MLNKTQSGTMFNLLLQQAEQVEKDFKYIPSGLKNKFAEAMNFWLEQYNK